MLTTQETTDLQLLVTTMVKIKRTSDEDLQNFADVFLTRQMQNRTIMSSDIYNLMREY